MLRQVGVVAVVVALAGCVAQPPDPAAVSIPLVQDDGSTVMLVGEVCRPDASAGPARVVVIAHGSPPVAANRAGMRPTPCGHAAVRWFTRRGYLVVLSMRRGYGATGGAYAENSGDCRAGSYEHAARASAQDIAATVAYAEALPGARPDGAVVVGQSAGGWGALGVNAAPHPGVAAIVSMAGGRGGHVGNRPNNNCHPENLVTAAGALGHTASTPMLWIYTANDSYFEPSLAAGMHQAYTAAGGTAELHALPAFAADGHTLFLGRGGSDVWGPLVEQYLRERGAT